MKRQCIRRVLFDREDFMKIPNTQFFIPKDTSSNDLRHFGEHTRHGVILREKEIRYLCGEEPNTIEERIYFELKENGFNILYEGACKLIDENEMYSGDYSTSKSENESIRKSSDPIDQSSKNIKIDDESISKSNKTENESIRKSSDPIDQSNSLDQNNQNAKIINQNDESGGLKENIAIYKRNKHFNRKKNTKIGNIHFVNNDEPFDMSKYSEESSNVFAVEGWNDYCLIQIKMIECPSKEIDRKLFKKIK